MGKLWMKSRQDKLEMTQMRKEVIKRVNQWTLISEWIDGGVGDKFYK